MSGTGPDGGIRAYAPACRATGSSRCQIIRIPALVKSLLIFKTFRRTPHRTRQHEQAREVNYRDK